MGGTGGGGTGGGGTASGPCPCSRRPGANNSFQCPMGTGETTKQVVGPAGGTISLHGQQAIFSGMDFMIQIPPNALTQRVAITITETTDPPPRNLIDFSPIYDVEPTTVVSKFPMKLTVPWSNLGAIPNTLAIYFSPAVGQPFTRVSDSYINAEFMQGSTTHFGRFIAAYPRTAAQANCP